NKSNWPFATHNFIKGWLHEMEEGHIDQDLNIKIDDESEKQSNSELLELFE
ncbi:42318_t:CDS:2, partial [Gigaspora margarita]